MASLRQRAFRFCKEWIDNALQLPANRIAIEICRRYSPKPSHPSYDVLAVEEGLSQLTEKPMLICWGEQDFCFTPNFRKEWQHRFPDAEVHAWDDVGHYVIEDVPERLVETMTTWLQD